MIHREQEDEFLEFDYDSFMSNESDDNEEEYDNFYDDDGSEDDYFDFDDAILDIDFSEIRGKSYKKSFGKAAQKIETKQRTQKVRRRIPKRPEPRRSKPKRATAQPSKRVVSRPTPRLDRREPRPEPRLEKREPRRSRPEPKRMPQQPSMRQPRVVENIPVESGTRTLKGRERKKISNVIVPSNQKVVVKGVSEFILNQKNEDAKKIGYYKGKKLKELNIIINNISATDFTFNLFDPSMPLDYLFSTGNNLNNKITIAGGQVSYSDVLFNLLANPALLVKGQLNVAGPQAAAQNNQSLFVYDKSINGEQEICPFNIDLQIDTMQVFSDVVYFDISKTIGRPFIPDGMETIRYTVLAGNSVSFTFFYKQVSLKKFFYKEARIDKEVKLM